MKNRVLAAICMCTGQQDKSIFAKNRKKKLIGKANRLARSNTNKFGVLN
jgi:hypothetical protein